jgi:hypothetical protein
MARLVRATYRRTVLEQVARTSRAMTWKRGRHVSIFKGVGITMPDAMPPAFGTPSEESQEPRETYPNGGRPEPPMRVVTKDWWTWREQLVPREVLEADYRAAEKKKAARLSLKSLISGRC